ncbi:MAG: aminodeoxychorismate lyase, partial [Bacteroidales bacterium]
MNSNKKKQLFILAALCLALLVGGVSLGFISANRTGQTVSLFVDADDTPDSVLYKVDEIGEPFSVLGLRGFMTVSRYGAHVHPGRYDIDPGMSIYRIFRRLRAGQQT